MEKDTCRENPWVEYERRKRELPPTDSSDYEKAIKEICDELGL